MRRSKKELKIKFLVERKFPLYRPILASQGMHLNRPSGGLSTKRKSEILNEGKAYEAVLKAKPWDELLTLYDQEWQAKAELEEQQRYFNHPSADADLEHWGKAPYWTIVEAIALNLGKGPERVSWETVEAFVDISPFAKKYAHLRDLAIRAVKVKQLDNPVLPGDFLRWAKSMGFDAPEELVEQVEKFSTPVTNNERTQSTTTKPTDNLELDTNAVAIKNNKPDKENANLPNSHPLAVFRTMENLKFTEIRFNVADTIGALSVIVKSRKKAAEKKKTVPLSDLGLTTVSQVKPNAAGMAFWDIVTGDFNYKDSVHKRRLRELSRALKDAFGIEDRPFIKDVPRFQIHERLKELSAIEVQRWSVTYNEGIEDHNVPLKGQSEKLEKMADKLLAGETEELDDDLSGFWNSKHR